MVMTASLAPAARAAQIQDCNGNGVRDRLDVFPRFGLGAEIFATREEPVGVVAGDFDLDGQLDLAVGNGIPVSGDIWILRNLGERAFKTFRAFSGAVAIEAIA